MTLVFSGAGQGISLQIHKLSLERPCKGDVFHEGLVGVAAYTMVERGGDQQGLVTVRQAKEAAAQVGPTSDEARREACGVKAQAEVSGFARGGELGLGCRKPALAQHGVGVDEEQPRAGGQFGSGGELATTAWGGGKEPRAYIIGYCLDSVFRAAIDDD